MFLPHTQAYQILKSTLACSPCLPLSPCLPHSPCVQFAAHVGKALKGTLNVGQLSGLRGEAVCAIFCCALRCCKLKERESERKRERKREGGGGGGSSLPLLLVSHHYVVVSAALRALNSDPKFRPDLELCWHACVWPGAVGVANKLSTHLMHKINAPPWRKPKTHTPLKEKKKRTQTKQKRKRKLQRTFCHGA